MNSPVLAVKLGGIWLVAVQLAVGAHAVQCFLQLLAGLAQSTETSFATWL
eukprot:COSAG02_NODE_17536_length_997_cov_1.337416_2_plen_49_part_01